MAVREQPGARTAAPPRRNDRLFYTAIAWTMASLVTVAFGKALIRNEFPPDVLSSAFTHAHALVFTGWIALFVTQATLIAAEQTSVHRKLGILGVILACSIVVLSIISTFRVFALGQERFFFANPHIEVIVFAILVVPAFVYRRNPDTHKRLVLLATISLIGAATVHLPFIGHLSQHAYLVVQDSFIAAGMAYDIVSRRRVHQTYIWGGLVIVFSQYVLWVNRL